MLVFPWYIRFGIDCVLIAIPFYYIHNHPTTKIFEIFQDKRQQRRRRTYEKQAELHIEGENTFTEEEAAKIYADLNMKYP